MHDARGAEQTYRGRYIDRLLLPQGRRAGIWNCQYIYSPLSITHM